MPLAGYQHDGGDPIIPFGRIIPPHIWEDRHGMRPYFVQGGVLGAIILIQMRFAVGDVEEGACHSRSPHC